MSATVRDIARSTGLSITTVSRALNDHSDVAPETKARIRAAADQLGYHPNAAARTLKINRANAIGLVVPLGLHRSYDWFWLEFIGGMAAACARHSMDLLVSSAEGTDDASTTLVRLVRGRRVDGVVVGDIRANDERIRRLQELSIPFVAFGRTVGAQDYSYVDVDGASGALDATLQLIYLGHRRIAYLGLDPAFGFSHFRLAGYREALSRSAIEYDPALVFEGLTEAIAPTIAHTLMSMSDRPSAVLAAADFLALAVVSAARTAGVVVPRDLSVISFDDNISVQRTHPPLTAIAQPNRRLGEEAGELLIAQLREPDGLVQRLIAPTLIMRSSTGPRVGEGEKTGETVA